MRRVLTLLSAIAIAVTLAPPLRAADEAFAPQTFGTTSFSEEIGPFLAEHCLACHGPDDQQAHVRLDELTGYSVDQQQLWTMVHEKIASGEMPPKDEPRPDPAKAKRVLVWIRARAAEAREAAGDSGRRRLNRRELGAALRDLTGLDVDYTAALPGDGKVAGFDTGADGLQDAADSVARALTITRRAVDGIRFLDPPPGKSYLADLRASKDVRKAFDPWKAAGFNAKFRGVTREGEGVYTEPKWLGERGGQEIYVPVEGKGRGVLRLRLVVSPKSYFEGTPPPHLFVEVAGQSIDRREITATLDDPVTLEYEVQLDDLPVGKKGLKIELSNRIELPYAIEGFENEDKTKEDAKLPNGPGLFRPKYDKKQLRQPEEQPVPFIVLQEIEIEPSYVATWPPAEWGLDVGEITDDAASAERLLTLWIDRAWRRPSASSERSRFLAYYERLRGNGFGFDETLRATFQAVLLSPEFRYLASPSDPDENLAQYAIASRLAFMLTGGPPDTELRELATKRKLRNPKVLDAQVDRLLASPGSEEFFEPFVVQWLEMEQPITLVMHDISQQNFRFGRYLKQSLRAETVEYVAESFRENRPARELVDSDWTMMNDSLAVHYGYDGVEGGELRKVKLRKDDPRGGGILGHAGIQSMLTWMGENWVIYRGAWTLRHVLDDPPPPPPLEVPELIPSDGENRGKTFRELLVQHQQDPNCAVCHRDMDPLGFAFQNFDLSGRWRDVEYEKYDRNELDGKIAWRGAGKTRPVDATGRLPRGETFGDWNEFKTLVAAEYTDDLMRGVLKNLVVYGTGRQPDVLDMQSIRSILDEHGKSGHRLRDVLKALIRSRVFVESS